MGQRACAIWHGASSIARPDPVKHPCCPRDTVDRTCGDVATREGVAGQGADGGLLLTVEPTEQARMVQASKSVEILQGQYWVPEIDARG